MIARVAVLLPVAKPFDYTVPPALASGVAIGTRVWAPWGARSVEGVVVALDPPDAAERLKALHRAVDAPPLAAELVSLASWVADYYLAPPGEVMRLLLPAGGGASARRTAALTVEGARAAESLASALPPLALAELPASQRAILRLLADRGPLLDEKLDAEVPSCAAALRVLTERGLVAIDEAVRTRAARAHVILKPARAPADGELDRAPRRAEVFRRVAEAGALALDELTAADARASAHVRALVEAGLVVEERREIARDRFAALPRDEGPPPTLTSAQAAALAAIEPALAAGAYAPFLLHGVTGSGKTEVYLRAIATALAAGKRALVLVPEISLTPQLAARFRGRFGDAVAVLHSALSDAERADAWRRIQRGQVQIALGARSAVFAPLEQLGIVIVDEEHDGSFKQQEGVRYHGRDVALVRARAAGAVAVLGSATPSLETFAAAREGRMRLVELPERATPRPLPSVEIVDLKLHKLAEGGLFSAPLTAALAATLAAGEQAILFLNRRGFSTFILCKTCGQAARCRDCSVALTYHRASDRLICHYCGFRTPPPPVCAGCGGKKIERLGYGTEQVEAQVKLQFPQARVARLDRDTAQGAGLERVLDGIRARAIDVVVGTQMITKGHDFPSVTLVGVVLADHGMHLPDFRAAERTYQLLEQVAGRAGRGERPGRVLVQTYNPKHPSVTCARDHDYLRFAEQELAARREPAYPPSTRLACLHVDGADPQAVRAIAAAAASAARAAAARAPDDAGCAVIGPTEAPLGRLKGRTRWQVFVKAQHPRALRTLARAALAVEAPRSVRLSVDVDPISML
ncbi:MAG TPA: primosomal protein N' [Polyangia bacterium]|nr:primosomal protein N' [Polyangia bacterium]